MNVAEYIEELSEQINNLMVLCGVYDSVDMFPCKHCALSKNGGKPCPLGQLIDVKRALQLAVEDNLCGITPQTDMDTAQVILFLRRAVMDGYSIRTLRPCSEDYIKEHNLIPLSSLSDKEWDCE